MSTIRKRYTIKFDVGRVLATPRALATIHEDDVFDSFIRHISGDWGEVCEQDRKANDLALIHSFRIVSVYTDRHGVRFWIITEADRSATTILLPSDY